jgi:hypothetical protein
MKTSILKPLLLGLLLTTALFSCQKENEEAEQSEAVKKYLELKASMTALNSINSMNSRNENADMAGNFMSVIGMSKFMGNTLDINYSETDSAGVIDGYNPDDYDLWEYQTCATVSETENEDGTYSTIYDYGEGCEEYGFLMKGKITYIWSSEGNTYYSKVIYENYYSYGTEINGYSEYSFTSDGGSYFNIVVKEFSDTDSSMDMPDITFNWSGSSTASDQLEYKFDDGDTYTYSSNYSNKWDNTSSTVLIGEYNYKNLSNGYEFDYEVLSPVITNYECMDSWTAVSGIEQIYYKEDGKESSFTLNYGDGTCDNLVSVTENGKTSIIDFGKLISNTADATISSPASRGSGKKK